MSKNKKHLVLKEILIGILMGIFLGLIIAGATYLIFNVTPIPDQLLNNSHSILLKSLFWITLSITIGFLSIKLERSWYLASSLFVSYILLINILNYFYSMYLNSLPYSSLPNIELTIIIFISLIIGIFLESAERVLSIFTKKIET